MKISDELKVGVLATIASVFMVLGYNFLIGKSLFSKDNKYYAVYPKVDGLTAARPVKVNGFQIGKVSELRLLPNGTVLVEFIINKRYMIPKNSLARIENEDLMGNKAVLIQFGDSKYIAKDRDTIGANVAMSLSESVLPLQQKVEHVLAELDKTLQAVNHVLNPAFKDDFGRTSSAIAQTTQNLADITTQIKGSLKEQEYKINHIIANLDAVTVNLKNNNQNISGTLSNMHKVSQDLVDADLDKTIKQTQKAIAEMQSILVKINSKEGTLGRLVNDQELYDNLNNLVVDLKSNPKRYVHFSMFGGRKDKKK